jgi:hypothetical protein
MQTTDRTARAWLVNAHGLLNTIYLEIGKKRGAISMGVPSFGLSQIALYSRPWQEYPLPNVYGSCIGHISGMFLAICYTILIESSSPKKQE